MSNVLITSCSSRKHSNGREILEISDGPCGSLSAVAKSWVNRHQGSVSTLPAISTYKGRGFSEAIKACAETKSELMIASAGLGLIRSEQEIPAYDATVSSQSPNSIARQVTGAFSFPQWWEEINRLSGQPEPIRALTGDPLRTIVVLALPSNYLALVISELTSLDEESRRKLRIIAHGSTKHLPECLLEAAIQYDSRFDGPDSPNPGTKSDFYQRAARHFMVSVLGKHLEGTGKDHSARVLEILSSMRRPITPNRTTATDEVILEIIREDFHLESIRGRSSSMLRHLRDNRLVACEQSRFRYLFNSIKDSL